ncbi:hypothetical protein HCX60_16240 [Streptomyces antibioticus]|uniref:Uncharacterized protein n=1 Tax=Streptomyces antibioticus TaxID=1890 RepID=A0AAE6Y8F7_STRAT|nr:hypothetical protein HCX60_16240 [Streptomyces antibioticus]
MANTETALKEALATIEGASAAALVDYTSGMALGTLGGSKSFDLNVAAAGNTDVVRAKMRTMEHLGLKAQIEDILITLSDQLVRASAEVSGPTTPQRVSPLQ